MTTQAISCAVAGTKGFIGIDGTATDGTFTSLQSSSLDLYQLLKGESVSSLVGSYTAGTAVVRIFNTVSNQVKLLAHLNIITEEETIYFNPITIAENDVLQVYCTAV